MASNDLQAAIDEYRNPESPYASLQDYLLQRPVYDRGEREAPEAPTMRTLEALTPDTDQLLAEQYDKIIQEQRTADEAAAAARQTEIDALRELLREELASSEDAASAQRSDITAALEGRIEDLRRGIDAETIDLRTAGLDERAALARQIEEGDRIVREAQDASIESLEARLGSLSEDLSGINNAIDQNYNEFNESQKAAADATQAEIDALNQELESLYTDVQSGNAAQSDAIRSDTANLIASLEDKIGAVSDNLGSLPIESIQSELAAVTNQAAQFQQSMDAATSEREEIASRVAALQASGLTQDDLTAAINPISQQRQEAISAAVDPIQQQIAALRQEIPQNIDVEALRKQIVDEVRSSLQSATPPTQTGTAPESVTNPEQSFSPDVPYGDLPPDQFTEAMSTPTDPFTTPAVIPE
jgi:archaellum component FlaC